MMCIEEDAVEKDIPKRRMPYAFLEVLSKMLKHPIPDLEIPFESPTGQRT